MPAFGICRFSAVQFPQLRLFPETVFGKRPVFFLPPGSFPAGAVFIELVRVRLSGGNIDLSLELCDLLIVIHTLGSQFFQEYGIPGYSSYRGSPLVNAHDGLSGFHLLRSLPFHINVHIILISGTEPDPFDLAVADLTGGQGFVDIVPAARQVGL